MRLQTNLPAASFNTPQRILGQTPRKEKHMTQKPTTSTLALLVLISTGSAQYPGWQHSGSLAILTTPDGANRPATASEENFPLLVRLNKAWFDFSQAKANGGDGDCPSPGLGNRHILLHFSHLSGGKYLLRDYGTQHGKFVVTQGDDFNHGSGNIAV
jgi:hypothetical protein